MAVGNLLIENYLPYVKDNKGIKSNLPVSLGGTLTVAGGLSVTGSITETGGAVGSGTEPTVYHTGTVAPTAAAAATAGTTNQTPVTTESYVCEVFIPINTTITGISVLNGTAVSGNINVGLANSAGTIVAKSATTTSGSGTTAYQQIPFTAVYSAVGPQNYFVVTQYSATTARAIAHTIGNFGATKVTSETYGTFLTTAAYATTTFTTAIGPVADTY